VRQKGPSSDPAREAFLDALVYDDPLQLYERAPCGFLSTTPDGVIVKCNATLREWLGRSAAELVGVTTFAQLLTVGGRIYHETHYAPMLRMQGTVREIALELVRADGSRLPVLVNATLDRDEDGAARVIRIAVFDATERRRYEHELLRAKEAAEESEGRARALAGALQRVLIPPVPPVIPDLDVGAAFRPAGDGAEVGGDFYDVFRAGDDWVVVLGDVCGKGVDAAVVAALVRHTLRALSVGLEEPSAMLHALNEVLMRHETELFCTLVVIRLHHGVDGWSARTSTAGHPLPLLVPADGPTRPAGRGGPLVGVLEGAELVGHLRFDDHHEPLAPGDVLVLYTDGVTEGRSGDDLFGEVRLEQSLRTHGPSASAIVDGLVEDVVAFQAGVPRDDVAVLVFRVPTVTA
jgi:sigma-B regulation protein RsbU (phosphoserine phosphatase)